MSDPASGNRNWWQEAKAMSLARRAALPTKVGTAKPGDAFLIVTEGTVTEPVYFELLRTDLQLPVVRVKVVPGDASDPRHVIRTAEREAKQQVRLGKQGRLGIDEPSKFDHVWAVIDTDVAVRNGIWNDVRQLAVARKVTLAHSTPCFEFWLLLHFGFTTRSDLPDGSAASGRTSGQTTPQIRSLVAVPEVTRLTFADGHFESEKPAKRSSQVKGLHGGRRAFISLTNPCGRLG